MLKGRIIGKYRSEALAKAIEAAPKYETDIGMGLTSAQVEERKKAGLANKIKKQVTKSYFRIFFDNLFSFFNLILFGITAMMMIAGIRQLTAYFFTIMLTSNILIGLISDIRARVLVDRLRLITDPKTLVIRDGQKQEIPVPDVVLSDIIYVKAGDQIPCDCVLLDGSLAADESLLTGEADEVKKHIGDTVLGGSFVKSGNGYLKAVKVGAASYSEALRTSAQTFSRPKSELKRSTMIIFAVTGSISVLTCVVSFLTYYIPYWMTGVQDQPFIDFVRALSGSMVAMIPSGLYLLTSLTLAVGVLSLARKRMNVQELYCIEMLARVDTVCFDKTGTLTDGGLSLVSVVPNEGHEKEEVEKALLSVVMSTGDENETAKAIKKDLGGGEWSKGDESIPFDSDRKYSATRIGDTVYAVGAHGFVPSKEDRLLAGRVVSLSEQGYRVIAVYKGKKSMKNGELQGSLTPIGLAYFSDRIKADAKENIAWFVENGVNIKVISGDSALTVGHIAMEVGVPNADKCISLEGVSLEETRKLANEYVVFGRVSPEQKAALIEAMQEQGHKVAMTGDGVNDMLALKKADCSIAMASGSAAARNISHLVALDNDFGHLPEVVGEGRRVINNLQRTAVLFLSKTCFAIVLTIAFMISSWCGGSGYPFTTSNMLLWEICSIGVPAFFISLQPTKERLSGSFLTRVLQGALPAGLTEVLVVGVIFLIHAIMPNFYSDTTCITMSVYAFSVISFVTLFRVCLPMDKFRIAVFSVMAVLALGIVMADILSGLNLLALDYDNTVFDVWTVLTLVGIMLAGASLYILVEGIVTGRRKAQKAKGEEK